MQKRILLLLLGLKLIIGGCATNESKTEIPIPYCKTSIGQNISPYRSEIENRVFQEMEHFGEIAIFKDRRFINSSGRTFYDIPITINNEIEQAIDYFSNKIPRRFSLYLARSTRYESLMRALLKQYALPEDLIYLALIESGFSCQAVSRAAAVGPWQFIKNTAIRYGLRVDTWIDERQDPIKSTRAAARYLRDLYIEFGSWYLAAAGYNSGENKIRRALTLYQGNDYWSISQHPRSILSTETKEYVPKMIAAAIIAKEPILYGFINIAYEPPLIFDEVSIHPGVTIGSIAKAAGLNAAELASLNPELKRGITPPFNGNYTLRVPVGTKFLVETIYSQLSPRERNARFIHEEVITEKGNSLQPITKTYNLQLNNLLALNPRLQKNRVIKLDHKELTTINKKNNETKIVTNINEISTLKNIPWEPTSKTILKNPQHQHKLSHIVVKGDTICSIAQQYNIDYKQIKYINRIKNDQLTLGQKIFFYLPSKKTKKIEIIH